MGTGAPERPSLARSRCARPARASYTRARGASQNSQKATRSQLDRMMARGSLRNRCTSPFSRAPAFWSRKPLGAFRSLEGSNPSPSAFAEERLHMGRTSAPSPASGLRADTGASLGSRGVRGAGFLTIACRSHLRSPFALLTMMPTGCGGSQDRDRFVPTLRDLLDEASTSGAAGSSRWPPVYGERVPWNGRQYMIHMSRSDP